MLEAKNENSSSCNNSSNSYTDYDDPTQDCNVQINTLKDHHIFSKAFYVATSIMYVAYGGHLTEAGHNITGQ
jgi:hypothetical protein